MARRWDRVNQWLFSKTAACVTACAGAIIVVGCMNISLGGHSAAVSVPLGEEQGTFEQTGRLPVRTGPVEQGELKIGTAAFLDRPVPAWAASLTLVTSQDPR